MELLSLFSLFLLMQLADAEPRILDWFHYNQLFRSVSRYPTKNRREKPECYNADGLAGKCIDFTPADWVQLQRHYESKFIQDSLCWSPKLKLCHNQEPKRPVVANRCSHTLTAFPPDPRTECCGREHRQITDRIAGGAPSTVEQFPWLAVLNYWTRFMCAGTLISSKYVLTAAHCLREQIPYAVTLGEYDLSTKKDCDELGECADPPVRINVKKRIIHPDFRPNQTQMFNDIGLIRMQYAAPYTGFIRPICLPNMNDNTINTEKTLTLFVAGWGQTSPRQRTYYSAIKNHAKLHYVRGEKCGQLYSKLFGITTNSHQICAAGSNVTDTCRGDSGGPLMYKEKETGRFRLVGIVSFGRTFCGKTDVPGVYTKVSAYNTWIRRHIEP